MDMSDKLASSRTYINDPFIGSARRRVEWSAEKPKPMNSPPVKISPQIAFDILNVMHSRVRPLQASMSPPANKPPNYWPSQTAQTQAQVPFKDLDIEEIADKRNPAYRTYDNSYASTRPRLFDTPPTNPSENMANFSSSMATSQFSGKPGRDTKSFTLTEAASPKIKEASLFSSGVDELRISDFKAKAQTPQSRPQLTFNDHFSIKKLTIAKESSTAAIRVLPKPKFGPSSVLANSKADFDLKDSSLASSGISRTPLALKGSSSGLGIDQDTQTKASLEQDIKALDGQIAALKQRLGLQEVGCSYGYLQSTGKKLQEVEKEMRITEEAINSLLNENQANKRRLESLHKEKGISNDKSTPANQSEHLRENTLLRSKLNNIDQEMKLKNAKKIESIKAQVLVQLQNEARFTKMRYATDRQVILHDMRAYVAFLEDRVANRPSIPARPSVL